MNAWQSVLSLSDQLKLFREYLSKIKSAVGEGAVETILSKSIVIVCTGSDDIANTYFSTPFRRPQYDINSYTDLLLSSATAFYKVSSFQNVFYFLIFFKKKLVMSFLFNFRILLVKFENEKKKKFIRLSDNLELNK